jgi:hypothetical protein
LLQNDVDQRPDIDQVILYINEIQNDIPVIIIFLSKISLVNNAFAPKSPKSLLKKPIVCSDINPNPVITSTSMRRGRPSRSEEKPTATLDTNFWDNWSNAEKPKSPGRNNVLRDDILEFDPLYSRSSNAQ